MTWNEDNRYIDPYKVMGLKDSCKWCINTGKKYVLYPKVKAMMNVVVIEYPLLHVIYYITLPNILDDTRK